MNRIARMLMITGFGLVAGTTIGAGPALAAGATGQAAAPSAASTTATQSGDRVVGFYSNLRSCVLAGRIGERFGRWDDFDCVRVRWGFHRGAWALQVSWDNGNGDWNGPWWPHGGGHGWPHGGGHGWPHGGGHDWPHGGGHDWPHGDGHDWPHGDGHDGGDWHHTGGGDS